MLLLLMDPLLYYLEKEASLSPTEAVTFGAANSLSKDRCRPSQILIEFHRPPFSVYISEF